jgi:hypothetical protein
LEVALYGQPAGGNQSALERLEQLAEDVRSRLHAARIAPGDTDPPTVDPDANVLTTSTPVTVRMTNLE